MMKRESPGKRRRPVVEEVEAMQASFSPKEVIASMNQAVTASQRLDVLNRLFQMIKYDTKNRSCHSDPRTFLCLVELGIVQAILLQLGFLIGRHGTSHQEIYQVATALDVFFRFSPNLVCKDALQSQGREFQRLLYGALRHGAILPVISIWHSCSANEFGAMMISQEPAFLNSITTIFQQKGQLCEAGCDEILGLLKNLTHFCDDIRPSIVHHHPSLLSHMISLGDMKSTDRHLERLSTIFRNLALSSRTRKVLAQRGDFLACIIRTSNSNTATPQIVRNLLNVMVNLAMDEESCLFLIFHGDGMLVEWLRSLLYFEFDHIVRKRAARVFRLLMRESSLQILIHNSRLTEALLDRALHDPNSDVRQEAADAFGRCAGFVKAAMMDRHDAVLDALTLLATTKDIDPDAICRAVQNQSSHPENRSSLLKRDKLLAALANMAVSSHTSPTAKEAVCSTFLDLSKSTNDETSDFPSTAILDALVHNAEAQVGARTTSTSIQEVAVLALINLSKDASNRSVMAKQARLIQSLIKFAAVTPEEALKREVKASLMHLAAEL